MKKFKTKINTITGQKQLEISILELQDKIDELDLSDTKEFKELLKKKEALERQLKKLLNPNPN